MEVDMKWKWNGGESWQIDARIWGGGVLKI